MMKNLFLLIILLFLIFTHNITSASTLNCKNPVLYKMLFGLECSFVNKSGDTMTGALNITNGGLWIDGTTGATPTSGAGTRLMWIPARTAFRVGAVGNDIWDNANIGTGSVAIGRFTKASNFDDVAIGYGSFATGGNSMALGYGALASNNLAFAAGNQPIASGDSSIAMGESTQAKGHNSVALGRETIANVESSVAIGSHVNVSGKYSVGIGLRDKHPFYVETESNVFSVMGGDIKTNENINLTTAAKGISLVSPSGFRYCITISDIGTIISTPGVCI